MKTKGIQESKERCAESGWDAYDIILSEPLTKENILKFRPLGAFSYLPMLKKPFFKVESNYYFIKGMEGDPFFRLAVHREYSEKIEEIVTFVNHIG